MCIVVCKQNTRSFTPIHIYLVRTNIQISNESNPTVGIVKSKIVTSIMLQRSVQCCTCNANKYSKILPHLICLLIICF